MNIFYIIFNFYHIISIIWQKIFEYFLKFIFFIFLNLDFIIIDI